MAGDIIRERVAAGLSQRELAKLAGIRVKTLCRIETGKHTPSEIGVSSSQQFENNLDPTS